MLEKIDLNKKMDKKTFKRLMPELSNRLYAMQKASWDAEIPVVILFEGWDAAGKGTSIQKLTSPLDPRGFKLYPVRAARTYEKKRAWLWRFWLKLPARGEWAIFDRSWYGRVLVERVEELIPESEWRRGYRDIVDFERTLADDGHLIVKFFLHISKQEQKRRFEKLTKDPLTSWKVTAEDWEHHRRYEEWVQAYEEAFERTDTEWGPWTIVEATDRRYTWYKIYATIINSLEEKLGVAHEPLTSAETGSISAIDEEETLVYSEDEEALEDEQAESDESGSGDMAVEGEIPLEIDSVILDEEPQAREQSALHTELEWALEESLTNAPETPPVEIENPGPDAVDGQANE